MSQQPQAPAIGPQQSYVVPGPPRRPGTVTAAAVLMFVFAGLAALGAAALLIASLLHGYTHFFNDPRFLLGLWIAVLAGAALLSAIFVLSGSGAGRSIAFVFLGAGAVSGLANLAGNVAELPFITRSGSMNDFVMSTPIYVLGLGLAVTPMLLLMGSRAVGWFHERHRTTSNPPAPSRRPAGLHVALIFLGLTGIIEGVANVRALIRMPDWVSEFLSYDELLATNLPYLILPLLVILAGFAGLAAGRDSGRVAARIGCGYMCFIGLNALANLALSALRRSFGGYKVEYDAEYWVGFGLTLAVALTAAWVLFALSRRRVADWFESRRSPSPTPPAAGLR